MDYKWLTETLIVPISFLIIAGAIVCVFVPDDKALMGAVVGAALTRVKLSRPPDKK